MLIGMIVVLGVAFVGVVAFCILKTVQSKKDFGEIEKDVPIITANAEKAKADKLAAGFVSSEQFSSFGYKFFEYGTKYNCPDNLNVEIDRTNKKIACYMLLPYDFHIYSFTDLFKCEFMINNGKVDISTVTTGVGTSVGGMGVGIGVTSGTAEQQINAVAAMLTFKNGENFILNFLNNKVATQGSDAYNEALYLAKDFCNKMEIILKEAESAGVNKE